VDSDLAGPPGPNGRHPLPEPAALEATLRAAGISAATLVVAYDAADGSVAARLWWLLRWVGHRALAVLDGGITAWRAAGLPVTVDVPRPQPGTITVRPGAMPVPQRKPRHRPATACYSTPGRRPVAGSETEPVDPRAGHIPGATNAPLPELTDQIGTPRRPVACWP
jgi:thiosulfate/3-mercaptopyruvate sulfurtransferase